MNRRVFVSLAATVVLSACGAAPASRTGAAAARSPLASWEEETFGPLRAGMTAEQAIAALGEPELRPEFVEMAATGERVAEWSWPGRGVSLGMVDGADGASVTSLTLSAPSELRATYGGVGLGSTRSEVLAAYAEMPPGSDDVPRDDPESPNLVRFGNAYACLSFHLSDDGRVISVFMGSTGAE
jgi:hypothetical protein